MTCFFSIFVGIFGGFGLFLWSDFTIIWAFLYYIDDIVYSSTFYDYSRT